MKLPICLSMVALLATSCSAQNQPATTAAAPAPFSAAAPLAVDGTRVARWQDDKKAVFLLMFDDGWPSGWQVAVPEMKKRNMIGTFYVCPGKGEYTKFEQNWLKDVVEAGNVLANHTWTHNGFTGAEDTEMEIGKTTQYLLEKTPGKNPRLISWGMPGVDKNDFGGVPLQTYLDKHNLISRGTFRDHGANYHLKTTEQFLALADKAIASGGVEYLVFHGLERTIPNWPWQDMWAVKQDVLFPFLDGLQERRDRGDLWITDHISQYKYEKERDTATVKVLEKSPKKYRLQLLSTMDAQLYDQPLTLFTQIPTAWKKAQVTQGTTVSTVDAKDGSVMYQATPNAGDITLQPA